MGMEVSPAFEARDIADVAAIRPGAHFWFYTGGRTVPVNESDVCEELNCVSIL